MNGRRARLDVVWIRRAIIGVYSVFFGKHQRPTAEGSKPRVFAFEPSDEAFLRLLQNLRANDVRVTAVKAAVAERSGFVDFYEPAGHLANGSLRIEFARYFDATPTTTRVLAVDGAMLEEMIGPPGRALLKIDAEGAEAAVLRTLRGFIEAHLPYILIEVLPVYVVELRRARFLSAAWYRFHAIDQRGLTPHEDFVVLSDSRDMLLRAA
jgi:FkbM family methyltransferase